MADRVSTVGVEVLNDGVDPNARVSTVGVEVLNGGVNPNARVSTVGVEVLMDITPLIPVGKFGFHRPIAYQLSMTEEEAWKPPYTRQFAPIIVETVIPYTRRRMPLFEEENWAPPSARRFAPVVEVVVALPSSRWRMPESDETLEYRVNRRRSFAPIQVADDGYTFIIF